MSFESHGLAINIEHKLSNYFDCERFGLGSYINSDSIERDLYITLVIALAPAYKNAGRVKQKEIDDFLENNYKYSEMNIEQIGISNVELIFEDLKRFLSAE